MCTSTRTLRDFHSDEREAFGCAKPSIDELARKRERTVGWPDGHKQSGSGATVKMCGDSRVAERWMKGRLDRCFREHVLFDRLLPRDRTQVRSQAGPGASSRSPLSCDSVAISVSLHFAHVPVWPSNRLVWPRHVLRLGFWAGGDLRRRVLQRACAAKLVDAWQQMCWFGTWTWQRLT